MNLNTGELFLINNQMKLENRLEATLAEFLFTGQFAPLKKVLGNGI
jgi:hypothetical protein